MKTVYVRNIIFGVTDSLISTMGLLSGVDASGSSHEAIIATGLVYAFVESLSMAVGSFLSEEAAEEFVTKRERRSTTPIVAGAVIFLSCLFSAFIPLLPYMLINSAYSLWISILLSLVTLFIVGLIIARYSKVKMLQHATKMVILGGAAILIGAAVGKYIHV